MTLSLLHVFGLMYLVFGLGMVLKPGAVKAGIDDLLKSSSAMFVVGFMSLFIGALIVTWHNTWNGLNEIIVSAIGWAAVLKGLMYVAFPDKLKGMASKLYQTEKCIRVWGVIVLAIGAGLMALAKGML